MAKEDDEKRPIIIIKRVKKVEGGHHGGAWKVAYADFVTAMMAFFLLLWLLNVTTDEQKMLISSYFAPADPRIAETTSGAGGVMGGTTMSDEGAMTDDQTPVMTPREATQSSGKSEDAEYEKLAKKMDQQDEQKFKSTEESIRQAITSSPELKELSQNLLVDMTPEGLRIQIVDQEGRPMFELGSAKPLPQAERLMTMIAKSVKDLPNKISIRGHTDSRPYGNNAAYTNWELSADRANASRRVMLEGGLSALRINNVQGKAEREPLLENDPASPRNRRISIILLKQSLTMDRTKPLPRKTIPSVPVLKKQEEGVIYFP